MHWKEIPAGLRDFTNLAQSRIKSSALSGCRRDPREHQRIGFRLPSPNANRQLQLAAPVGTQSLHGDRGQASTDGPACLGDLNLSMPSSGSRLRSILMVMAVKVNTFFQASARIIAATRPEVNAKHGDRLQG